MKVFIVEDSKVIRGLIESMLIDLPMIELVGSAGDEAGAIMGIEKLLPDVVILDLNLKPGSGISVLEKFKNGHAGIKFIVLTNYVDDFYFKSCKAAGANYFFDKTFQFSRVRSVLWSLLGERHPDSMTNQLPELSS